MKITVKAILALCLMSTIITAHGEENILIPFKSESGKFCANFDEGTLCSTKVIEKDGKPIISFENKMICSIYKENILECSLDPLCAEKVSSQHGGDGAC